MKTQKIIILIGISGSGKTTYAKKLMNSSSNFIRVNRDDIRKQITASNKLLLSNELEELVTKFQDEQIRIALKSGFNIVVDNTNLKQKYINDIINQYNHLADIEIVKLDIHPIDAKMRVARRDGTAGNNLDYVLYCLNNLDYIDKQYITNNNLNLEKFHYPKKVIEPYVRKSSLQDCIICDLDGTLSLYDHNEKSPYDRDFENDNVNEAISSYLDELSKWHDINFNQFTKIFFFSGRNSKFEKQTRQFLNKALDNKVEYTLVMRNENDTRRDSVIKLEMFEDYVRDKYNVLAVFDDRLQVIEECWNPLGVFVFNCNNGAGRF